MKDAVEDEEAGTVSDAEFSWGMEAAAGGGEDLGFDFRDVVEHLGGGPCVRLGAEGEALRGPAFDLCEEGGFLLFDFGEGGHWENLRRWDEWGEDGIL